jgi:hypothetical protein
MPLKMIEMNALIQSDFITLILLCKSFGGNAYAYNDVENWDKAELSSQIRNLF